MRGFKTIPPPQKYMDLCEIHTAFGTRGVVAYGCRIAGGAPQGGFVVAVQEGANPRDIKEYLRQFKKKFPNREPVCYIRVPLFADDRPVAYVYDTGSGERKAVPEIKTKEPSEAQRLVTHIPDEVLALMLQTAFKRDET